MKLIPILGGAAVLLIAASVTPAVEQALDDQGQGLAAASPAPERAEEVTRTLASNQPIPGRPAHRGMHELLCRAGWL